MGFYLIIAGSLATITVVLLMAVVLLCVVSKLFGGEWPWFWLRGGDDA